MHNYTCPSGDGVAEDVYACTLVTKGVNHDEGPFVGETW